ncbi:TPA: type II toxin-antitoxin system RelE/ParE family toxin [Vibrio parahaemolyticus]
MAQYKLSPAAQEDMINIRRCTLESWGSIQYTYYFGELKQSTDLLANNELIGIDMPEFGAGYCRFPLKHHVIYYIRKPDHIIIAAVLGRNMSPAKHFQHHL